LHAVRKRQARQAEGFVAGLGGDPDMDLIDRYRA